MAELTDEARKEVWAEFMREVSRDGEPLALTKADLREAVDALDAFMRTNAAAVNSAIPQPARGALTTAQKARLLRYVVKRRFIDGA